MHAEAPERPKYDPVVHDVHWLDEVAPVTLEYIPTAHKMQVAADVALAAEENVPATHAVHAELALTVLNKPASHWTQTALVYWPMREL